MDDNNFMSVEVVKRFDVLTNRYVENMDVKINMGSIRNGIIKEIGATDFCILVAIAGYMDEHNKAFPSQRKIAEITGLSIATINRGVARLTSSEDGNVPVITREFRNTSKGKYSEYTLGIPVGEQEHVASDEKLSVNIQKGEKPKPKVARDYAHLFKHLYEEKYGLTYVINYKRDLSMIKGKLMSSFSEDELTGIIEYAVENYRAKWASPKYPYPTIGALCSWIANAVLQEQAKENREEQRADAVTVNYEESMQYMEQQLSRFDDL